MLDDITVDTNVMVHAGNPNEPRQAAAHGFLIHLLQTTTDLCLDEGFSFTDNKSRLGAEYLRHIVEGSMGFIALVDLLSTGRIRGLRLSSQSAKQRRALTTLGFRGGDRNFVAVAAMSDSKVFVTHDFATITPSMRTGLWRQLRVAILDAQTADGRL